MISKITSGAILGVDGYIVDVEVDTSQNIPSFEIVGLPDSAVKESKERVRAAIKNSGYAFPSKKIVVNLAPADIRKEGPSFDLPIAVALLVCMDIIPDNVVSDIFIVGELSLDGNIRSVTGVLPMIYTAAKNGINTCVVPYENANEAALVKGVTVYAVENLKELIRHLNGTKLPPYEYEETENVLESMLDFDYDFFDVKGQETAKRALEISASGMHNVMMIGPPGSGKTMMAKRIPGILPNMNFDESIEVTKIYSIAGMLKEKGMLIRKRPYRDPHHTISYSALVGGGRIPTPGEISLSHNGVLFLDELPEFQKNVLEVLRQPLEEGSVTISRVSGTITYPSNFMLVASMNPCPCGYYGDDDKCSCSKTSIAKYLGKISGPLLDRIDIQIEVPAVNYKQLGEKRNSEKSAVIKERITKVHEIQKERYKDDKILFNSQLTPSLIEKHCELSAVCQDILQKAAMMMGLSARAFHKVIKLARTIADINGSKEIERNHIAEAIQYRSLDRKYW